MNLRVDTRPGSPADARDGPRARRSTENVVRTTIVVGSFAAVLMTALSLLGRQHWVFELLTHFRMHAAVGCGLLALAAVVVHMPRPAGLLTAVGVVNLGFMAPYLWPVAGDAQAGPPSLRLLSVNVGLRNDDYAATHELISGTRPDVIGVMEADANWSRSLESLAREYPYRISRPREDAFGLVLLSRYPLQELEQSPHFHDGIQTAILAELQHDAGPATIVLAHVHSPMTPHKSAARNAQLAAIAAVFRDHRRPAGILFGDLNMTPWSPYFAELEAESGLRNAARGQGYLPTWPTALSFMGIPIDHCLLSDGLDVERIRTGPDIGSDHRPLFVDIRLRRIGFTIGSDRQ